MRYKPKSIAALQVALGGVCTENLNPDIMVMKSAENRV